MFSKKRWTKFPRYDLVFEKYAVEFQKGQKTKLSENGPTNQGTSNCWETSKMSAIARSRQKRHGLSASRETKPKVLDGSKL